ncbi:MAG: FAD-binding oxidoreductase [Saprospiraceae bacterium]|nr:FAD-binding oxidoreductase [Saprospiraceae bacterium]
MIYDYLIIGQGLAGTLLAYELQKAKQQVYVLDPDHNKASSKIAAGLVNPITGRRFVKSWRVDELIPFAEKYYTQMSQDLGFPIYYPRNLSMLLSSPKMQNDWMQRSAEQDVEQYVVNQETIDLTAYRNIYKDVLYPLEFYPAARVDIKTLIETYRAKLLRDGRYTSTYFDYKALKYSKMLSYKGICAWKIIFCEGYQAIHNPFFKYLPFKPAKGEVLLVRIPNYTLKHKLVKHGVFIIHWQADLYWIGSSYDRNYTQEEPTKVEQQELIDKLKRALRLPFELVEHKAAIRPTVRDRRPFLGRHPKLKQLHIFNGLGAKGSYLGPYFARQMAAFLLEKGELDTEVDINRYFSKYFVE